MLSSPRTYEIIRDSGFICLPSKRTLRDYTNCMTIKAGFQYEVFLELKKELKIDELPEWKRCKVIAKVFTVIANVFMTRYMVLAFDEMKVKEDLVFSRSGNIVGYVSTSDMDDKLREFEKKCEGDQIANHVLALMVRGIFVKFDFEFAQFPTRGRYNLPALLMVAYVYVLLY